MSDRELREPGSLTAAWCSEYLRRRLPEVRPDVRHVEMLSLLKLPRGVSRETWLAETLLTDQDGNRSEYPLTIRRDHAMGGIDSLASLHFEYEIYRLLGGTAVPVARPLWFADDPRDDPDGRAHYVREHVVGHWDIPHFRDPDPAFDELRIETSKLFLDALASVHTLDWASAGFGEVLAVPRGAADCASAALNRELGGIDTDLLRAYPAAVAGIHALRASLPPPPSSIALCKGTSGLGEEIWHDGRLVAMSDWESCSLGDPAGDFARLQEMIPTVLDAAGLQRWGAEQAMEYYTSVSGIEIDPQSLAWYRDLYGLTIFRYGITALRAVKDGSMLARMHWNAADTLMLGLLRLAGTAGIGPLPQAGGGLRA